MDDPAMWALGVLSPSVLLLSVLVTSWLRRLRVLDLPNDRSSHRQPIPRIGGIAIMGAYLLGFLALVLLPGIDLGPISSGFAIACLFIAAVGLLDDVGRLRSPVVKLLLQLVGALVLVMTGVWFRTFQIPFYGPIDLGWLGPVLTVLWLVGVTNAVNFMDGLNGLAAGTCAVAAACFAYLSYEAGATGWGLACGLMVPAILGFLPFNFPRATIFMGDVGSQFLGFSLAAISVVAAQQPGAEIPLLVMPLLLCHFLFDTAFTLIRRYRDGERISQAHRSHLYQLVNRLGWSHPRVSAIHFAVACLQGVAAILVFRAQPEIRAAAILPFLALQGVYAFYVVRHARRAGLIRRGRREPD